MVWKYFLVSFWYLFSQVTSKFTRWIPFTFPFWKKSFFRVAIGNLYRLYLTLFGQWKFPVSNACLGKRDNLFYFVHFFLKGKKTVKWIKLRFGGQILHKILKKHDFFFSNLEKIVWGGGVLVQVNRVTENVQFFFCLIKMVHLSP